MNVSHGIPPQVISPLCRSEIDRVSSIPIVWTPVSVKGFNITYELEYVIDDQKMLTEGDYQAALNTTDTKETGLVRSNYTFFPDNVLAEIPYRFIYRIKAVATSMLEGVEVFVIANEGYSDICYFDYIQKPTVESCTEITMVGVDKNQSGPTFATINWSVDNEVTDQVYTLSYRPSSMPNISAREFKDITAHSYVVNELIPETSYLFTVKADCNTTPVTTSEEWITHTTERTASPIINCGEKAPFDPVNASNLLGGVGDEELSVGKYIYIRGVPIVIETVPDDILAQINKPNSIYSKLPKKNSDGSFTGYGRITFAIPLFQQSTPGVGVAVTFKNLFIDKDYNVIAGYVETIYDPGNWKTQMANLNAFNKGGKLFEKIMVDKFPAHTIVKGVIGDTINMVVVKDITTGLPTYVTINYSTPTPDGTTSEDITLTTNNPADITITNDKNVIEESSYYIIKDAESVYYGIDMKTGEIIPIGRYNPDITTILADIDPDKIDHANKITFENGPSPVFAFDPAAPVYNSNMLFQKPYLLSGSPDYPLRWKFMTTGSGTDKVVAKMPAGIVQNKETLKFVVTSNNTEIDYTPGTAGSDIELNLMPATSDAVYSVHAVVKVGEDWQQAGRFDVLSRTAKNYTVTLVPMGGNVPSATDTKTALDKIWKPYGITWTVNVDDQFYTSDRATTIDGIVDTGLVAGDKWPSEYCQQQLDINKAYRDYAVATNYSKESMYVFVLPAGKAPNVPGDPGILKLGDMPLGKQWGYLFGTADTRTLAHELGHGKTKLPRYRANPFAWSTKINSLFLVLNC